MSEPKVTTLECMICRYRETFTDRQFRFIDGLSCVQCSGPVSAMATMPGEKVNSRRGIGKSMDDSKIKGLKNTSIKVEVDMDTDMLQLKLRTISKHLTALADELEKIEGERCGKCGSRDVDAHEFSADGKLMYLSKECKSCGHEAHVSGEEFREATQEDFNRDGIGQVK